MTLLKEDMPIAEISIGKAPTEEIDFTTSGALPIGYLNNIYSLLERRGYDSNKLELTCKSLGLDSDNPVKFSRQYFVSPNEKYANHLKIEADNETGNEIRQVIERIPLAKIKRVSFL